jgi:hypothetical protein
VSLWPRRHRHVSGPQFLFFFSCVRAIIGCYALLSDVKDIFVFDLYMIHPQKDVDQM